MRSTFSGRSCGGQPGGDFPIRVRIGIHTGEAIRHGDDFFGRSVVLAARIAARAEGGDILISSLVRELTAAHHDIVARSAGQVEFKGLDGVHELFRVAWAPATTMPDLAESRPARAK